MERMIKINLKLDKAIDHPRAADRLLTLPFGERSKSRLRAILDNGEEAGLFLERGTVLRHGDELLVVTLRKLREKTEDRLRAVSLAGRLAHWLQSDPGSGRS